MSGKGTRRNKSKGVRFVGNAPGIKAPPPTRVFEIAKNAEAVAYRKMDSEAKKALRESQGISGYAQIIRDSANTLEEQLELLNSNTELNNNEKTILKNLLETKGPIGEGAAAVLPEGVPKAGTAAEAALPPLKQQKAREIAIRNNAKRIRRAGKTLDEMLAAVDTDPKIPMNAKEEVKKIIQGDVGLKRVEEARKAATNTPAAIATNLATGLKPIETIAAPIEEAAPAAPAAAEIKEPMKPQIDFGKKRTQEATEAAAAKAAATATEAKNNKTRKNNKNNKNNKNKKSIEGAATAEEANTNNANISSVNAVTWERPSERIKSTFGENIAEQESLNTEEREGSTNRNLSEFEADETEEALSGNVLTPPDLPSADNKQKLLLGDPSLPGILRIGDDSSSEQISLIKGPFISNGQFRLAYQGSGPQELPKLQGVRTPEQFKAMQQAFGVTVQGKQAPIIRQMQKKCKFPGYDLVMEALRYRQRTLGESIQLKGNTRSAAVDKQRLKFVTRVISEISKFKKMCSPEELEAFKKTGVTAAAATTGAIVTGAAGCPCLEEMNLLRDLVQLVTLLQGNASAEVKQQLQKIPLQKLLDAAAKNNISSSRLLVKEALETLRKLLTTEAAVEKTNDITVKENLGNTQELLVKIQKILSPMESDPKEVTVEKILGLIEERNKDIDAHLEKLKSCETTSESLKQKEAELAAAQAKLAALEAAATTKPSLAEEEAVQLNVTQKTAEINELKDRLAGSEAEVAKLRALLEEEGAKAAAAVGAQGVAESSGAALKAASDAALADLNRRLEAAEQEGKQFKAQLEAAEAELQGLRSAASAELDALKNQHAALKKDAEAAATAASEAALAAAAWIDALTSELESAKLSLATANESLAKKGSDAEGEKKILADQISDLTRQIQVAQEATIKQSEESATKIQTLETAARDLETKILDLTSQGAQKDATLEAMTANLDKKSALAVALQGRLNEVEPNLAEAKARVAEIEAEVRSLRAANLAARTEAATSTDALRNELSNTKTEAAGCQAELASIRARLPELEALAIKAASLEEQLMGRSAELEAEKAKRSGCETAAVSQKQQHAVEIVELETNLAAARVATEEIRRELEALRDSSSQDTEQLSAKLEAAESKVASLESELAAKSSSGSAAAQAFEEAKKESNNRIADLEKELAELRNQIPAEKERIVQEERAAAQKTIDGLQAQITSLSEQLEVAKTEAGDSQEKAKTNLIEFGRQSDEKLAKSESRVQDLEKQLTDAKTALGAAKDSLAAAEAKVEEITKARAANLEAKDGTIASLQRELANAKQTSVNLQSALNTRPLQTNLESRNATISARNTEITTLKAQIAALQTQQGTDSSEVARLKTALGVAQEALEKAQSEGASAVEAKESELAATKAELISLTAARSKNAEAHQKEVEALRASLSAAEAVVPRLSEKEAELAQRNAELASARLDLESKNAELAKATAEHSAEITELRSELTALKSELPSKVEEVAAKDKELVALAEKLEALKSEAAAEKEAGSVASEAAKKEINEVRAQIRATETEKEAAQAAVDEERRKASALEEKILAQEAACDAAVSAERSAKEAAERRLAELEEEVKRDLQDTILRSATLKKQIDEDASTIEKQLAQIAELEAKLKVAEESVGSVVATEQEKTRSAMQNLLSWAILDDELLRTANEYLSGTKTAENTKKVFDSQFCEFFHQLVNMIQLQQQKISSSGLPSDVKEDIFRIFKTSLENQDKVELLKEISGIFQELFVNIESKKSVTREITLKGEQPILSKLVGMEGYQSFKVPNPDRRDEFFETPLKQTNPGLMGKLMAELGSFGYLSSAGIAPTGLGRFVIRPQESAIEFQEKNTKHQTPLSVIGIKMIQLLAELQPQMQQQALARCGMAA